MEKKNRILVLILSALLILSFGYIAYDKYFEWKQKKEFGIFQQGANFGYEQAIGQVYSIAIQCQQIPLMYQNQTINLVSVDCLKK